MTKYLSTEYSNISFYKTQNWILQNCLLLNIVNSMKLKTAPETNILHTIKDFIKATIRGKKKLLYSVSSLQAFFK